MLHDDEQAHLALMRGVMSDQTPLVVTISIKECWLLISWLQLVARHPGVSPAMRAMIEVCGRQFQTQIEVSHPEVLDIIEMGWDERFDVKK